MNTPYPMNIHQPALSSPSRDPRVYPLHLATAESGGGGLHGERRIFAGAGVQWPRTRQTRAARARHGNCHGHWRGP